MILSMPIQLVILLNVVIGSDRCSLDLLYISDYIGLFFRLGSSYLYLKEDILYFKLRMKEFGE